MKRLAAVCAVFLIVVAGCGSESQSKSTPFKPKAGDIKLPPLPTRGLIVDRKGGAELIGLDGRRYGFLRGLSAGFSGFARSVPLDLNRPRLDGKGKGNLFDAADGYSLRTRRDRSDLGHGFEYRDISTWKMTEADKQVASLGDPNDEAEGRVEIYRDGKPFLYLGGDFGDVALTREGDFLSVGSLTFAGSKLIVNPQSRLIDLSSGSIEPLPAGCVVYGRRAGVLNAICTGRTDKHGYSSLLLRRKDGKRWPVVYAWKTVEGEWRGGVLSPDERHLVVTRFIPCDTETVEIVDAQGPKRKELGKGTALGWSAAGEAIVYLEGRGKRGCDASKSPSGAVYAVDPVTLKRALIVRTSAAKFWDKSARN